MAELLTVGHGTATRPELASLLRDAEIGQVVDIRRFPGSRRNRDVASEELARWLPESRIGYRWEPRLGGRRRLLAGTSSPDTWWRVEAFRAYASYMRSEEFEEAMADLLAALPATRTAVMCSETLWWRCHRRMVSDAAVLLHGVPVRHLMHDGTLAPHRPAEGARVTAEGLVYDGPETR